MRWSKLQTRSFSALLRPVRTHDRLQLRQLSTSQIPTEQQQKEITETIIKEVAGKQSLTAIVKDLDKLKELPRDQLQNLWDEYHQDKPFAVSGPILQPTDWIKIKERAVVSPFFILPNVRSKGSYFVMLTEYREEFVLMTFLDDYKRIGSNANPWSSITFFPDVESSVLVQTKFAPYLKEEEAKTLTSRWINFYKDDKAFETGVWTFNKMPENFNFSKVFPEVS